MMLFKRWFGLTRSLFILYVNERDRLGFGMLTVETAVILGLYLIAFVDLVPIGTEKVSLIRSNIYLESVEEYSEGKIHKSESELGNGNLNTEYFVNQARGNTRICRTEFVYDERARDCKCLFIFVLPA